MGTEMGTVLEKIDFAINTRSIFNMYHKLTYDTPRTNPHIH